jgi:hypothetical protein
MATLRDDFQKAVCPARLLFLKKLPGCSFDRDHSFQRSIPIPGGGQVLLIRAGSVVPVDSAKEVCIRAEDHGAGEGLDLENLANLRFLVEVEMHRNKVLIDELRDAWVVNGLLFEFLAVRAPFGPKNNQNRLVFRNSDLAGLLEIRMPLDPCCC